MRKSIHYFLIFSSLVLFSCGGKKFERNPVDDLIRDLSDEESFSIILYDMDVKGNFFQDYEHRYKVITTEDSVPKDRLTGWIEVPEDFFWKHENHMGMEIASKVDGGTVSKVASPPGYDNYVGNSRYGYWNNSGGNSFWTFYGQYAFLSTMLNLGRSPIYRSDYMDYRRNYRGSRPYYGGSGTSPRYGTFSRTMQRSRPDFFQRRASNYGWSSSSRISRSSDRYGTGSGNNRFGSSYRSSGGGFGK